MHTVSKVIEAAKLYAKGLTTKEVSEQTGVSEHTLSNWRTKHSSSYITKLVKRNTKSSSGNKGVCVYSSSINNLVKLAKLIRGSPTV